MSWFSSSKKNHIKSPETPSAPRLRSVGLPVSSPSPVPHHIRENVRQSMLRQEVQVPPRSKTPSVSRTKAEPLHDTRPRATSISSDSKPLKSILKPAKPRPQEYEPDTKPKKSLKSSPEMGGSLAGKDYDVRHYIVAPVFHIESDGYRSDSGYRSESLPSHYSSSSSSSRHHHSSRSRKVSLDQHNPVVVQEHGGRSRKVPAKGMIVKAPLKSESIALNWPLKVKVLKAKVHRPLEPFVYFDIAFDPRDTFVPSVKIRDPSEGWNKAMPDNVKKMPASSHCTLTEMEIICEPLAWWPVRIRRYDGIRCWDIFEAIFETFNKPITYDEKCRLDAGYLNACEPAFEKRCHDVPGLDHYNLQQGLLRVDLLKGKRLFDGLEQRSDGKWILKIDNQKW